MMVAVEETPRQLQSSDRDRPWLSITAGPSRRVSIELPVDL